MPMDMWTLILETRAIVLMQTVYRSFRVRHGPVRYLMKLVSKGWLPASRACYSAIELQHRGVSMAMQCMYVACVRIRKFVI